MDVAVEREEAHGPRGELVVPLVAGEVEVVEVRLDALGRLGVAPVVVAQAREEAAGRRAGAVGAAVVVDVIVVVLADVGVDSLRGAGGVVVVAGRDDERGVPALHQRRDVGGGLFDGAEVADDGEGGGVTGEEHPRLQRLAARHVVLLGGAERRRSSAVTSVPNRRTVLAW
jgi:hypothetical protein